MCRAHSQQCLGLQTRTLASRQLPHDENGRVGHLHGRHNPLALHQVNAGAKYESTTEPLMAYAGIRPEASTQVSPTTPNKTSVATVSHVGCWILVRTRMPIGCLSVTERFTPVGWASVLGVSKYRHNAAQQGNVRVRRSEGGHSYSYTEQ